MFCHGKKVKNSKGKRGNRGLEAQIGPPNGVNWGGLSTGGRRGQGRSDYQNVEKKKKGGKKKGGGVRI